MHLFFKTVDVIFRVLGAFYDKISTLLCVVLLSSQLMN